MSEPTETPEQVADRLVEQPTRARDERNATILHLAGASPSCVPLVLQTVGIYPTGVLRQFLEAALRERDEQWRERSKQQ